MSQPDDITTAAGQPKVTRAYDYIFLGAGLAALSLLMRMIRSGRFTNKSILLADRSPKKQNDRTWCFWEKTPGFFEEVVHRQWDTLSFFSDTCNADMPIAPYRYKMIRGIDLYNYCYDEIRKHSNIDLVYGEIENVKPEGAQVSFLLNGQQVYSGSAMVFSSMFIQKADNKHLRLLQHFKGKVIRTATSVFDTSKATLMDFRVHQHHGTTFAYMLPLENNRALVEYTLFTKELLQPAQYDAELDEYIRRWLQIDTYECEEEEFGIIPMTDEYFPFYHNGMYHLGSAGGQTKGSSGYTFQFIQKHSDRILQQLMAGKPLQDMKTTSRRFRFYDNTLLHVLYHNKLPGSRVFSTLFRKNKPQQVLQFLDNETSLGTELKLISGLPVWPFLKAALKQV
ncbi:MAG: hypothetical protein JNM88_02005 [Chitinophagaceae bacterium]|nr:hypothetical protein [Chitinophagaceae bacterium]